MRQVSIFCKDLNSKWTTQRKMLIIQQLFTRNPFRLLFQEMQPNPVFLHLDDKDLNVRQPAGLWCDPADGAVNVAPPEQTNIWQQLCHCFIGVGACTADAVCLPRLSSLHSFHLNTFIYVDKWHETGFDWKLFWSFQEVHSQPISQPHCVAKGQKQQPLI